jgi:hypothetical protein
VQITFHLLDGFDAGALFLYDILELVIDFFPGEPPKAEYVLLIEVPVLLYYFSNFILSIFY